MKKMKLILCLLTFILFYGICIAAEIDIGVFGFSYHFDKNKVYKETYRRLDNTGVSVINPGISLGYDFRQDIHKSGFSPTIQAGFFQNCSDNHFMFAGAGLRYRKFLTNKLFWSSDVLGLFVHNKDYDDEAYLFSFIPYANLGIGYDFGKFLFTTAVTYVPANVGNHRGSDLVFLNLMFSF